MRSASLDPAPAASGAARRRPVLRALAVASLAAAAFLVSLALTLPARTASNYAALPVEINGYSGTVWNGAAHLDGGHTLRWRLNLRRSFGARALALDLGLEGPGTDLEARLSATRRTARLDGTTGVAAWPLVMALAPDLAVTCDVTARLEGVAIALAPGLRSGAGLFQAGPGACLAPGRDAPVPVPPLSVRLAPADTGLLAVLSRSDAPEAPLARAEVTADDRLLLTVYPEGAALVPGLPQAGEIALEYPLDALPL